MWYVVSVAPMYIVDSQVMLYHNIISLVFLQISQFSILTVQMFTNTIMKSITKLTLTNVGIQSSSTIVFNEDPK